jgi:hypothetical protein
MKQRQGKKSSRRQGRGQQRRAFDLAPHLLGFRADSLLCSSDPFLDCGVGHLHNRFHRALESLPRLGTFDVFRFSFFHSGLAVRGATSTAV